MVKMLLVSCMALAGSLLAHQPRIVESDIVGIQNPEVSQAFYGELNGTNQEFRIHSDQNFDLYVGLLVPDSKNISTDISVEIDRIVNDENETIASFNGSDFAWTPFYEKYANDHYLWGPEYKAGDSIKGEEMKGVPVPAGDYRILVSSPSPLAKYVLVTGFREDWPISEMLKAAVVIPRLKAQFFAYPLSVLILSPYVWGYILTTFFLAFLVGFLYRFLLKKFAKNLNRKLDKNIGKPDRLLRFIVAIGLFVWAVTTSWSFTLLFFSGFTFFEAMFSWCGLYAALGASSCPVNNA